MATYVQCPECGGRYYATTAYYRCDTIGCDPITDRDLDLEWDETAELRTDITGRPALVVISDNYL